MLVYQIIRSGSGRVASDFTYESSRLSLAGKQCRRHGNLRLIYRSLGGSGDKPDMDVTRLVARCLWRRTARRMLPALSQDSTNLVELPPSDVTLPDNCTSNSAISHRGKIQVPECEVILHCSARSNKYDGFRVHAPSDIKRKPSKVKPRHTPAAPSSVIITELDEAAAQEIPPPTPIQVIQQVGVLKCTIPAEELTEYALLASKEAGPSSSA